MSNQQKQEDAYDVTAHRFDAWGGLVASDKIRAYINEYAKTNGLRLINTVTTEREFVFFWAKK